jgi:hypothetical protein
MSQQDDFAGGFLLGTLVGGVVGGVIGALVASGKLSELVSSDEQPLNADSIEGTTKPKKRSRNAASGSLLKAQNGQQVDIEAARRGLEDKIAQLNDAIDDVRQKLGGVNGTPGKSNEPSTLKEP